MIVVVTAGLVVEVLIGVAIGYALGRRDDDQQPRRGQTIDLTRAAARGEMTQ